MHQTPARLYQLWMKSMPGSALVLTIKQSLRLMFWNWSTKNERRKDSRRSKWAKIAPLSLRKLDPLIWRFTIIRILTHQSMGRCRRWYLVFVSQAGIPSEHTWKTTASKNAGAIYARFMALGGSRKALMDSSYTEIGIGIAQKNGYYNICIIMVN